MQPGVHQTLLRNGRLGPGLPGDLVFGARLPPADEFVALRGTVAHVAGSLAIEATTSTWSMQRRWGARGRAERVWCGWRWCRQRPPESSRFAKVAAGLRCNCGRTRRLNPFATLTKPTWTMKSDRPGPPDGRSLAGLTRTSSTFVSRNRELPSKFAGRSISDQRRWSPSTLSPWPYSQRGGIATSGE